MKLTARSLLQALACLLLLVSLTANAKTRAWLDRDHITLGETATLNIETDTGSAPEYAPLARDFELSGRTSSKYTELGRGKFTSRTLYAVALRPRRDGVLTIPGIAVGGEKTNPLPLKVGGAIAAAPMQTGADVFLESQPDDTAPYVQQTVGWTVRLYSAVPLVSGQLDQATPEGASLSQVGEDLQFSRQIDGRDYSVVERHYVLVPDRSGPLEIPGAVFRGRGVSGFFGDLMGRGDGLQARAPARHITVRTIPAQVSQEWLPLHGLQLRYLVTPQGVQAGAVATLSVEAIFDGASASQLPELRLPDIDGVQVFPDPVQADERWVDGRPQVTLRRQFVLVPSRAGALKIPGAQLQWWDVNSDTMRTAALPTLELDVAAAPSDAASFGGTGAVAEIHASDAGMDPAPIIAANSDHRPWVLAAVFFGLAWLLTLLWGLHRAPATARMPTAEDHVVGSERAPADLAGFAKALDHGDFEEVATRLCKLAWPPARDIDELRSRLADPAQHEAVGEMQRARWGDGDGVAARQRLRRAFANPPQWHDPGSTPATVPLLPPLYPRR